MVTAKMSTSDLNGTKFHKEFLQKFLTAVSSEVRYIRYTGWPFCWRIARETWLGGEPCLFLD